MNKNSHLVKLMIFQVLLLMPAWPLLAQQITYQVDVKVDGHMNVSSNTILEQDLNVKGQVSIGTNPSLEALTVAGNVMATGTVTAAQLVGDALTLGSNHLAVSDDKVGIGTTSPSEKFHLLNGTLKLDNSGVGGVRFEWHFHEKALVKSPPWRTPHLSRMTSCFHPHS